MLLRPGYRPKLALPSLTRGLVGWWRLDGYKAIDFSGNNNNEVSRTGATPLVVPAGGIAQPTGLGPRGGMLFAGGVAGTGEIIQVNKRASMAGKSQITYCAWVKLLATPTQSSAIFGEATSTADTARLVIYVNLTTPNYFMRYRDSAQDPTGSGVNVSGSTLPLNKWSHLTTVYDSVANLGSVYLNGVLDNSAALSGNPLGSSTTSSIGIGGLDPTSTGMFPGIIDDVRSFSRVLTPAEIFAISREPFQPIIDVESIALMQGFQAPPVTTLGALYGFNTHVGRGSRII